MPEGAWTRVWWAPWLERKTGLHRVGMFSYQHGTAYRRRQREIVLEQSEDLDGTIVQTVRLSDGSEIMRRIDHAGGQSDA